MTYHRRLFMRVAAALALGLRSAFQQLAGLTVAQKIVTGERFALMMPKDSPLLQPVNDANSAVKADGTMAALYERWLGLPPAEASLTVMPRPIPMPGNC